MPEPDDRPADHPAEPVAPEVPLPAGDGARPASGRLPRGVLVAGVALVVVAVLGGVWALTGRGGDGRTAGSGSGAGAGEGFWGHRWQLERIEGDGAPTVRDVRGAPLVLDAGTKGAISYTGCNGGAGGAAVEGSKLVLAAEGLVHTDMACVDAAGGQALMDYDTWMGTFLASRPTVAVAGSILTLRSDLGTVTWRRATGAAPTTTAPGGAALPADPDAPASSPTTDPAYLPDPGSGTRPVPSSSGAEAALGQDWQVISGRSAAGPRTLLDDRDGNPLVIDLTQDGQIGFNGCNGGGADVTLDGGRLRVGTINSTRMACTGADGEALVAQDRWVTELLESDPLASVQGNVLTLDGDALSLTAQRVG